MVPSPALLVKIPTENGGVQSGKREIEISRARGLFTKVLHAMYCTALTTNDAVDQYEIEVEVQSAIPAG